MNYLDHNQTIEGVFVQYDKNRMTTISPTATVKRKTKGQWTSIKVDGADYLKDVQVDLPKGFRANLGDKVRFASSIHTEEDDKEDGSYMHRTFETVTAENLETGLASTQTFEIETASGRVVWSDESEGVLKALSLGEEWTERYNDEGNSYALVKLQTGDQTQTATIFVDVEEGQRSIEDCLGHRVKITETAIKHFYQGCDEGTAITQVLEDLESGREYSFTIRAHQIPDKALTQRGWDVGKFRDRFY